MQADRLRVEAAGLLDPRPETAQRPEFRNGEELVRIGDSQEGERLAGCVERMALRFESAQVAQARRQHGSELLRLARTRFMIDASVRQEGTAGKALSGQVMERIAHAPGHGLPG